MDTVVIDIAIANPQEFQIEIPRDAVDSIKEQMERNSASLRFVDADGVLVVIPSRNILSLAIMEKQEGVEIQPEPQPIHKCTPPEENNVSRPDFDALLKRAAAFTIPCGSCDAGLRLKCVCPQDDPRGLVADLATAVTILHRDSVQLNSMCYQIGVLLGLVKEGEHSFEAPIADILKKLGKEYERLLADSRMLTALQNAGVI